MIDLQVDLQPELDALARRLRADGHVYKIKETYAGMGLTILIRRRDEPSPDPMLAAHLLREACRAALRDGERSEGADGWTRVRLAGIAARLEVPGRFVAKALRKVGLTCVPVQGVAHVLVDAAWNRFVGTGLRTPVV
jgi:hypothetical protein